MTGARGTAGTLAILAAIATTIALQIAGPWGDAATGPPPAPWPSPAAGAPSPRVGLGVTTLSLARNSHTAWRPDDLREVNRFERQARHHADTVMWFADWENVRDFDGAQATAVAARGSIPEIAWEPWDAARNTPNQPRYRLARIIAGDHDDHVRRWARAVAAYGRPLRLRFAQEMNGTWYPWAESANGNRAGEYVRAWRHVRALFDAAGADNVAWIWAPVAGTPPRPDLYPGSRHVDVLGVTGFNGGTLQFRRRWRSFGAAFGGTLDWVHALDRARPVELAEVGSVEQGGSKVRWIEGMFDELDRRPYVRALTWFNLRKEADWRISSSIGAQTAFADGINRASG